MSSIAKTNISLSKKDLTKNRIPPVASRNVVFYHKATLGDLSINLLSLSMPSAEMPTASQATVDEISGAKLLINKKNLDLISSSKGKLIQDLDYIVIDSYTISLVGPYIGVGAEPDEIFVGTINSAPISDLVVASAKSVVKTYELAIGNTILNLGREYQVGANVNESIGSIKVYVNGILALRDVDYTEVDSGSGYGTTIQFTAAPISLPHEIVVDFGVMSITDNNAIGAIENLAGSIKKIADDLSVVAGTTASDYYSASPSEVERRTFGDTILELDSKYDTTQNLSEYTKTKWQTKFLTSTISTSTNDISDLRFNNLSVGKTYRVTYQYHAEGIGSNDSSAYLTIRNNAQNILRARQNSNFSDRTTHLSFGGGAVFVATDTTLNVDWSEGATWSLLGGSNYTATWIQLEELPNHEQNSTW